MGRTSCDALIVGSGMGGMGAAALLAREGLKVIVAEGLPRLGGRCSTVEYRGFRCTTGVIGVETGGPVESVFRKTGAAFHVKPAGPPHYFIRGKVHRVPPRGGMRSLLLAGDGRPEDVEKVLQGFSRAMGWMEPSGAVSLKEWLSRFTRDEGILGIFQTMVSAAMVVNADELPAREFFRFLKRLGGIRSFGFCPAGSIDLPRALSTVIKESGGEIWTGAPVRQILVENGAVRGAKIERKGTDLEVRARVVISNAGPRKTVRLAGEENFDRGYLGELERNVRPAPLLAVQIGADEPLIEQDYLLVTGMKRVNALFQPTLLCPELAPSGKHLIIAGAGPASSMPPLDAKTELALCLDDLKSLIRDFDKRARILFAGSYHGDWPGMHCWPGWDLPQKTPVVHLYNVGDGVKPPGTVALPGAAASALAVVEDILGRLPKTVREDSPGMVEE